MFFYIVACVVVNNSGTHWDNEYYIERFGNRSACEAKATHLNKLIWKPEYSCHAFCFKKELE